MEPIPLQLPVGRLEAFSDAVFAIAITLLVLEIGVSTDTDGLLHSIVHAWPSYLAYATSFLSIGVIWLQHSAIVGSLRVADATLYRLNILVLLLAAFLPFPTHLLAQFIGDKSSERVAAVFYGLTLLALALALELLARYAARLRREAPGDVAPETVAALVHTPSVLLFGAGIGMSLLFPTAGVITYLASAIARGLPADAVRRTLKS